MLLEDNDSTTRYKKGIAGYIIGFYVLSIFISIFVMSSLLSKYSISSEVLNTILGYDNLRDALDIYPDAVKCYLHISSLTNVLTYILLTTIVLTVLMQDFINDAKLVKDEIKEKNIITVIKKAIIFFFIFYLMNIGLNLFLQVIEKITGFDQSSENQLLLELAFEYHPVLIALATIIFAPIVEEMIFRKCMFGLFNNKTIALIVSSLSFGVIHIISSFGQYSFLETVIISIPYIASGFILGFIYMKASYNIYYPIFVHLLSNAVAITFMLFL